MDRSIGNLAIEHVQNGFCVYENAGQGVQSRKWVFESGYSLGQFVEAWGHSKNKKKVETKSDIE